MIWRDIISCSLDYNGRKLVINNRPQIFKPHAMQCKIIAVVGRTAVIRFMFGMPLSSTILSNCSAFNNDNLNNAFLPESSVKKVD